MRTSDQQTSTKPQRFRRWSAIALGGVLISTLALSPSARGGEPLRSGTILSGASETPVNPWVRGMEGCVGAPTCSAWLQSGCAPGLAGADPALHASIVDVGELADGVTARSLDTQGADGPLIVQFWNSSDEYDVVDEPSGLDGQGCEELLAARVAWDCQWSPRSGCEFRIPVSAVWMTVSSRLDHGIVEWSLA